MIDASEYFVAGGTMRAQAPSYVTRPADKEFLSSLMASEFCYVLTSRQMGKSSLMVRTAQQLREHNMRTSIIDLSSIGTTASDEWYLGLLSRMRSGLRLSVDVQQWWFAQETSAAQRLIQFLRDHVLAASSDPVVIFIDEIDSTLNLSFRDDFFAAIRAVYNARASHPIYRRITFALLGVAAPTELIQDRDRTPFNIGRRIDLKEFSLADAQPLVAGLDAVYPGRGEQILKRIFFWTAGHPYLTQRLCLQAVQSEAIAFDEGAVDNLVAHTFLSDEGRKDPNLTFIQDRILSSPPAERRAMLKLYNQVYTGNHIADDDRSLIQNRLELYGLVQVREQVLHVRNEIYLHVFDRAWISAVTPSDGQQRTALYAVLTALIVVGAVAAYFIRLPNPTCETLATRFKESNDSTVRINALAGLFQLGFRCGQDALRLFYLLDGKAQDRLFLDLKDAPASADDLNVVVSSLYVTLDRSPDKHDQVLLEEMSRALELSGAGQNKPLVLEISSWLNGRRALNDGQATKAVSALTEAISVNGNHPVTHFDRAMAYVLIGAYTKALQDLDETVRIAMTAPPTPTPVPASPTSAARAASPTVAAGHVMSESQKPTSIVDAAPPIGVMPASTPITSTATSTDLPRLKYSDRFMNSDRIRETVRETILGTDSLQATLIFSFPSYGHLAADADLASAIAAATRVPIPTSNTVNPLDQAEYIYIAAGPATIGLPPGLTDQPANQSPPGVVNLDGYWLKRTEVTNSEYARCVQAGACTAPANHVWEEDKFHSYPVANVTWAQANDYARWIGGRLPTEAEWEKGCRGRDGFVFPWGNAVPRPEYANYGNFKNTLIPVGFYAPKYASPYGLVDMAGNAAEWTANLEMPYPYHADDGREDTQAAGPRVLRGGSNMSDYREVRCTARHSVDPNREYDTLGFRVVWAKP